jgi:carboxyl-terminal processing protease
MKMVKTQVRMSYRRSITLGVLLGIALAAVFAGGFLFRDVLDRRTNAAAVVSGEYVLLDEVQRLLDRHYLREQPDFTLRQYAAVRGMLSALGDRFTFFIDPPVAASESDALAGTYGGIGVDVVRSEGGEILLYPFDDSPAAEAGIIGGDVLIAVNGAPVDLSLSQDALDQLLRGEVRDGNGVTLTLRRADEERTLFVPFAVINVPSVIWRVLSEDERLGYVHIKMFTGRTPEELAAGLNELRSAGVRALIVDLRGNTGGLLQESIQVADEFIDDGVLVYERNNAGQRAHDGQAGGLGVDLPLIVLVNNRTASGAELVAGAIQDRERGILIGQRTFGKGTVQQIFPLSDGSSLHVTSSEWFTPAQQPLEAVGLTPDVEMIPDGSGRDVELGEAIRRLQAQLQEHGS